MRDSIYRKYFWDHKHSRLNANTEADGNWFSRIVPWGARRGENTWKVNSADKITLLLLYQGKNTASSSQQAARDSITQQHLSHSFVGSFFRRSPLRGWLTPHFSKALCYRNNNKHFCRTFKCSKCNTCIILLEFLEQPCMASKHYCPHIADGEWGWSRGLPKW